MGSLGGVGGGLVKHDEITHGRKCVNKSSLSLASSSDVSLCVHLRNFFRHLSKTGLVKQVRGTRKPIAITAAIEAAELRSFGVRCPGCGLQRAARMRVACLQLWRGAPRMRVAMGVESVGRATTTLERGSPACGQQWAMLFFWGMGLSHFAQELH